ncbi:thiosulfate oxidation carrier complex protein SoxZ [Oceanibium sediminis]|uniref:thiosulfate oxidation carrier complex protein SoxZ n=1 Tax=Oceanibium sediminis TaxID=2026339 RepID=UPI000DD2E8C2|nr:thiosulfate oxidation carrier complex protein SoxZ [Oceanibium sediminis]
MATELKTRVKVPSSASAGEVVTIKAMITHPMENGRRKDSEGNTIPRSIINRLVVDFNGQNVIDVALEPSVSRNPYFQFDAVVPESGEFKFTWYDDEGSVHETARPVTVT